MREYKQETPLQLINLLRPLPSKKSLQFVNDNLEKAIDIYRTLYSESQLTEMRWLVKTLAKKYLDKKPKL
jgi:hypothetical protein